MDIDLGDSSSTSIIVTINDNGEAESAIVNVEEDPKDGEEVTCRICRESSLPLMSPCSCSGSMSHVHFDCLKEWISHSGKTECDVCRSKYKNVVIAAKYPWPWKYFDRTTLTFPVILLIFYIAFIFLDTIKSPYWLSILAALLRLTAVYCMSLCAMIIACDLYNWPTEFWRWRKKNAELTVTLVATEV